MVSCRAAIALATESTRNGMSSLTMPIRIRRLPASPPVDSIVSPSSPRLALRGDFGEELGRFALSLAGKALGFAGKRVPVSALRIDSTSGGSRRVWAVMERFCSASEDAAGL